MFLQQVNIKNFKLLFSDKNSFASGGRKRRKLAKKTRKRSPAGANRRTARPSKNRIKMDRAPSCAPKLWQ